MFLEIPLRLHVIVSISVRSSLLVSPGRDLPPNKHPECMQLPWLCNQHDCLWQCDNLHHKMWWPSSNYVINSNQSNNLIVCLEFFSHLFCLFWFLRCAEPLWWFSERVRIRRDFRRESEFEGSFGESPNLMGISESSVTFAMTPSFSDIPELTPNSETVDSSLECWISVTEMNWNRSKSKQNNENLIGHNRRMFVRAFPLLYSENNLL